MTETTTGDDVQDGTGEVLSQELVQGKYVGCQRGCQPNTSGSQTKNEPTDGDTNEGEPPDETGDKPRAEPAEPDASGHEAKMGYQTPDQPSDLASQSEASDKTGDAAKEDEADMLMISNKTPANSKPLYILNNSRILDHENASQGRRQNRTARNTQTDKTDTATSYQDIEKQDYSRTSGAKTRTARLYMKYSDEKSRRQSLNTRADQKSCKRASAVPKMDAQMIPRTIDARRRPYRRSRDATSQYPKIPMPPNDRPTHGLTNPYDLVKGRRVL